MPLVTRQANQGNLFKQTAEPPDWLNGDLWSDISTSPPVLKINDGGTASTLIILDEDTTVDFNGIIIPIEALF